MKLARVKTLDRTLGAIAFPSPTHKFIKVFIYAQTPASRERHCLRTHFAFIWFRNGIRENVFAYLPGLHFSQIKVFFCTNPTHA